MDCWKRTPQHLLDSRCLETVFPAVLNRESIFVALPFVYLFSSHRLPKPKPKTKKTKLWGESLVSAWKMCFCFHWVFFCDFIHGNNKQHTVFLFLLWSIQSPMPKSKKKLFVFSIKHRRNQKNKKTQWTPKKQSFRLKPKILLRVFFWGVLVLAVCDKKTNEQ